MLKSPDVLSSNPKISQDELRALHEGAWRWTLSLVSDPQLAEDVLQEVYTMIVDGRACFDGRSTLKTWLYAVIRNTGRKEIRSKQRRVLREASLASEMNTGHEATLSATENGHGIDRTQRTRLIAIAITNLPQRQREILELVVHREFTLDECAEILGISLGSVRTHYHRGKDALKRSLSTAL
jgi:RNA polymerase sigma factor (sigma-70 family)